MANENMNINVEKKKKMTIVPVIIILIIIVIGIVGIVLSDKKDDGTINGSIKENSVSENNTAAPTVDDIGALEELQRKNEQKEKLDKVYEKYNDWSWASKGASEKVNLFSLKDSKIIYENGNSKQEVSFTEGTPKYIRTVLSGGTLSYLIVITDEGEVYNLDLSAYGTDKFNLSNLDKKQIEFKSKIVDVATSITGAAYQYVPIYLTENAELLNKDGKTYEELLKDHVLFVGTLSTQLYVNQDRTLELLRNYESSDYMYIIDEKGDKVKAKAVFKELSTRWTGLTSEHYYIIDDENNLLHFSDSTLFVAKVYNDASDKKVKTVKYDESKTMLTIEFEDSSSITMNEIYSYNDLSRVAK